MVDADQAKLAEFLGASQPQVLEQWTDAAEYGGHRGGTAPAQDGDGRLMGADCIITGIRPQITCTVVSLGIECGDVLTKQPLADGLAYVLSRSGLKVVPA